MKFALLSVFLITFTFVNADSSESLEDIKEIAKLIEDKLNITIVTDTINLIEKIDTKCPDIDTKLDGVVEEVTKCLDGIELGSETFCSLIRQNGGKCSKPLVDVLTSCMPDESKDIPSMLQKMIHAVVDQACNSTVEEMLELLNPCGLDIDNLDNIAACNDIKSVFDQHKHELPSKSLICSMIPKTRACVKANIEASCQNPITRKAVLNFQDAIEDALKDDCNGINKV